MPPLIGFPRSVTIIESPSRPPGETLGSAQLESPKPSENARRSAGRKRRQSSLVIQENPPKLGGFAFDFRCCRGDTNGVAAAVTTTNAGRGKERTMNAKQFACGGILRSEYGLKSSVEMWREHGCYHVRAMDRGRTGRSPPFFWRAWSSFRTLSAAKRAYRRACRIMSAAVSEGIAG